MGLHVCKLFYLVTMDVHGFTWQKEGRGLHCIWGTAAMIHFIATTWVFFYFALHPLTRVNKMASGRRPEHQAPPEVVSCMRLRQWNCNVWFLFIEVMPEIVWITYFSVLQRRWSSEIHFKVSGFLNVYNMTVTRVLSRSNFKMPREGVLSKM